MAGNAGTTDRELARTLLVELLAYQFAFPVRWIETQDELLKKANVRRIVEVGPSKVLSTMAQKTWKKKLSAKDALSSTNRSFLSSADDTSSIYYKYEGVAAPEPAATQPTPAAASPAPTPAAAPAAATTPAPAPVAAAAAPSAPAAMVEDTPLTALDVVVALSAQKLKKAFDELPLDKSIRDLCAGKSTLQNELIGVLGAEFGTLPDGAEDLSASAIASAVESGFTGAHGKQLASLVARLLSAKMPAGFNSGAALKQHLETYWGLGPARQLAVLGFAVSVEPAARLGSVDAAKAFVDDVVRRYGSYARVALTPGGQQGGGGAQDQHAALIDAATLGAITAKQEDYLRRQYELLSAQLGMAGGEAASRAQLDELEEVREALAARLQRWGEEFDDAFWNGIQPAFDAKKERRYRSAWNWAREDLVRVLRGGEGVTEAQKAHLLNRWDGTCQVIAQFFAKVEQLAPDDVSATVAQELLDAAKEREGAAPVFRYTAKPVAPRSTVDDEGVIHYEEMPRETECKTYPELIAQGVQDPASGQRVPYVHLCKKEAGAWTYDSSTTAKLLEALVQGGTTGLSFAGKTALVTGAGPGSIGAEVVRGLIAGGARVIVTTSRAASAVAEFYSTMYREHGAAGSDLVVLPFNQGSATDVAALVSHVYNEASYGGDLDFVVPFAAISETGQEIDRIDGKSELAHRIMLINVLRMLGQIKQQKEARGLDTHPTTVVLPLSPNHGTFGGDGLYAESKLGLETLFNRFHSENWGDYLAVCGAVIGWTRGTGLMSGNNMVAAAIEDQGCITFNTPEMAFNILALLSPAIRGLCEHSPVYADLNGGLQFVPDLKQTIVGARKRILDVSRLCKALVAERKLQEQALHGAVAAPKEETPASDPHATVQFGYPSLAPYEEVLAGAPRLQNMIDLSRTVVVVGYSELGPWGSARTRWDMEQEGKLSWAGYVEMAWLMGLVRFCDGEVKGKPYVGWLDAATGEPVRDIDFEKRYGEHIDKHAGIRIIEPEGLSGYDPTSKELLHEVVVEQDLPAFGADKTTAQAFKKRHGDAVDIRPADDADSYTVQVKKGAHFLVPKAVSFDRQVAGQLPRGWDPKRYGVPDDIIQQVDPITIYTLCCVNEALVHTGFSDPFEIWQHIHVSELANCVGTGCGSLLALRAVYCDRYLDKEAKSDVLQESFSNAMDAWANMLLLSSAGPIRSPSGTCATALESLDIACEALRTGAAKMAVVGGSDDFQEELSYEFGNMKATASSVSEMAHGRLPREMSRPMASSRAGFVESAGCGVQILMTAELALKIGAPIHAIVAHTQMSGDRIGRSVPAPGQGVLAAAREDPRSATSPLLDLDYRRRHLEDDLAAIREWRKAQLRQAASTHKPATASTRATIDAATTAKTRAAQSLWTHDIRRQDPGISPLRAALAVWGLTVDDIAVASFHGTSTKANDKNESNVVNSQMAHLGRSPGNPLLVVAQKYLTGHPKGAAGAWMLNGCLQAMATGVVPGNGNADDVDGAMRGFSHLVYPGRSVRLGTGGVRAFMLTSFGFGQKGGLVLGVAPRYLFGAVEKRAYEEYCAKVVRRQQVANARLAEGLIANDFLRVKAAPPWRAEDEAAVLLDPHARIGVGEDGVLEFDPANLHGVDSDSESDVSPLDSGYNSDGDEEASAGLSLAAAASQMVKMMGPVPPCALGPSTTVGIDVENVANVNAEDPVFLARNYTEGELTYCKASPDPNASLAGRWAAKEAVFKSLNVSSKGAGAAMRQIEIVSEDGIPIVKLHGEAKKALEMQNIKDIRLSISHSDSVAIAIALASRDTN